MSKSVVPNGRNEPTGERSLGVLVHGIGWHCSEPQIEVCPGIWLLDAAQSPVHHLYERLCAEKRLDDGEPFYYEVALVIKAEKWSKSRASLGNPYCMAEQFCNVLAIVHGQPIGMALAIQSKDNFDSSDWHSDFIYTYSDDSQLLLPEIVTLSDASMAKVMKSWKTIELQWEGQPNFIVTRLENALTYFWHAWKAHMFEQICINLAIVLETLFAPHSQSELSHQIAFNVSRFLGSGPATRKRVFREVKSFYSLRSELVHGGLPKWEKMERISVEAFRLCTEVLQRILLDESLASTFGNENRRRQLLESYLFD